eukprot:gene844-biopygen9909
MRIPSSRHFEMNCADHPVQDLYSCGNRCADHPIQDLRRQVRGSSGPGSVETGARIIRSRIRGSERADHPIQELWKLCAAPRSRGRAPTAAAFGHAAGIGAAAKWKLATEESAVSWPQRMLGELARAEPFFPGSSPLIATARGGEFARAPFISPIPRQHTPLLLPQPAHPLCCRREGGAQRGGGRRGEPAVARAKGACGSRGVRRAACQLQGAARDGGGALLRGARLEGGKAEGGQPAGARRARGREPADARQIGEAAQRRARRRRLPILALQPIRACSSSFANCCSDLGILAHTPSRRKQRTAAGIHEEPELPELLQGQIRLGEGTEDAPRHQGPSPAARSSLL